MLTIITLAILIIVLLTILLTKGFGLFIRVLGALALIDLIGGLIIGLVGVGIVAAPILIDVLVTALIVMLIIALVKKSMKKK